MGITQIKAIHALISPHNPSSPLAQCTPSTQTSSRPPRPRFSSGTQPEWHKRFGNHSFPHQSHIWTRANAPKVGEGTAEELLQPTRAARSPSWLEQRKEQGKPSNPIREIQIVLEQEGLESPSQGTLHLFQVLEVHLHAVYHSFNTQLCYRFETVQKTTQQGVKSSFL